MSPQGRGRSWPGPRRTPSTASRSAWARTTTSIAPSPPTTAAPTQWPTS
jgi:hypothetical protein